MKEWLVKHVAGNRSLSDQVRFKHLMPLHLFEASSSLEDLHNCVLVFLMTCDHKSSALPS